jgi:hypothetical protein
MSILTPPAPPAPTAAAPPPHRTDPALRRLLAAGAAIFAIAAVAGGALMLLGALARDTEVVTDSYAGVRALRVDAGSGDVRIVQGARGAPVRVVAQITRSFRAPERLDRVQDGVLRLAANCRSVLGLDCHVDYDITVPPGMPVAAYVGSGDTRIAGLRSTRQVVAHAGSGNIELRDVSAPSVDLRVGSGDITGDLRRSPSIRAELGSGDLVLGVTATPKRVRTVTGSGDVQLTVPGTSYRIDTDTGSGDVTADDAIAENDRAPRRLHLSTGSGDIDLRAGG